MKYQLIRSKRRKTIGLQIKQGEIFIRAPEGVSDEFIEGVFQKKSAWIEAKVLEQQKAKPIIAEKFVDGGHIYLWGNPIIITVNSVAPFDRKNRITHNENQLIVSLPKRLSAPHIESNVQSAFIKKSIELYYQTLAENYLVENLENFIVITGLKAKSHQIKKYKARWGSCNSRKELSFNYLLVMTPPWVFDYVIIHELCHLKHLNHSKAFWQLVAHFYPNYLSAKQWLKEHNQRLQW